MQVSVFGHPLQLSQTANVRRVRAYNTDHVFFDQVFEVLPEVNLLTSLYTGSLAALPAIFYKTIPMR